MPTIHVCPLRAVPRVVTETGAVHLLTVIEEHFIPDTPPGIAPGRHLRLGFDDIIAPAIGMLHPTRAHVADILAFAASWDQRRPMVVHCWAGISRSTAAAFITLCALNPEAAEGEIARRLRARSPTATPNILMIEHADDALGRKGRMIEAIEDIGSGLLAVAQPFSLPARIT